MDGEVFVHMISYADALSLKLLDQAQCDHSHTHWLGNDGAVVAGVEINSDGAVTALLDLQILPSGRAAHPRPGTRPHARSDVCHLYQVQAPGQTRGTSMLAPVVLRTNDLDQFTDAQLMRQKLGAMLCGFVTDSDQTLLQDATARAVNINLAPASCKSCGREKQ